MKTRSLPPDVLAQIRETFDLCPACHRETAHFDLRRDTWVCDYCAWTDRPLRARSRSRQNVAVGEDLGEVR